MRDKHVRDEIPSTETGLNLYLVYCLKQIKENKAHIKRLETRIEWTHEKAKEMGITLKEGAQNGHKD